MHYVGIDVHKNSSQICSLAEDGKRTERRIRTTRETLRKEFGGLPTARIVTGLGVE